MRLYKTKFTKQANKMLDKLDPNTSRRIKRWVRDNLEDCENPRAKGKALKGNLEGLWRYAIGDYRIIADIQDDKIIILITEVGDRKEIYKRKR